MKGIVRGINVAEGTFLVDCGHDRYAVFRIARTDKPRGALPRGGEYVRWNDEAPSVAMVMGEISGTMLVDRVSYPLNRADAMGRLEAVAP